MTELATHPIRTKSVFPKTIAGLLAETVADLNTDKLMLAMGEPAFPVIGATALFREILAEFSFMFKGVSLLGYFFFTGLSTAVAFGGDA